MEGNEWRSVSHQNYNYNFNLTTDTTMTILDNSIPLQTLPFYPTYFWSISKCRFEL